MPYWLLLLMMILVTYRGTWLITRDSLPPIRRVRERLITTHRVTSHEVTVDDRGHADPKGEWAENRGPWEWAATLVTCQWCMSVWVAAFVTLFTWLTVDSMPAPLLWFGAVAAGSTMISVVVERAVDHDE